MAWRPRDRAAFAHTLLALLPLGEVWSRSIGSALYSVMQALAAVVERWAERVAMFLLSEAFPPTSYQLLPDWERVLGLPEPCLPAAETLIERRAAVFEKLRRRPGAQNRDYYIDLAWRLGYHEREPSPFDVPNELFFETGRLNQTTIREFRPFMFGVSRFGDSRWRFAPHQMRFTWVVSVPGERLTWFRFGASRFGMDPHMRVRRADDLECILKRLKPAHSNLIFSYTGN